MSRAEINIEETQHLQNKSFSEYNDDYSDLFYCFTGRILDKAKNYDIIILTTRRCFDLVCCVYENYIQKDDEMIALWNKFISSQAINIKKKEFTDKRVLLVDDIMIHGKAVYSLYKKLRDYNVKNIDTFVLARNIELPDFYNIVVGEYEYMYRLSQEKWLKLSNKIVEYFIKRHSVYVSYVYALKGRALELINDNYNINTLDLSDNSFDIFEQLSGFNTNNTEIKSIRIDSDFVKNNIYFREYSFKKNDKFEDETITVPFCFLETFASNILINSWDSLLEQYKVERLKENISDSIDIYKSYTLIYCYFLIDNLENIKITEEIEKSFYEGFYEDLSSLIRLIKKSGCDDYDKLSQLLKENGLKTNANEDFELLNQYSFNDQVFNTNLDFKKYISRITESEDKLFKKNLTSYYNCKDYLISLYNQNSEYIPIELIYRNYNGNDIDVFNAFLILLADSGSISFNTAKKIINNIEYVTTVLKTGEQSYRLIQAGSANAFALANRFFDFYSFINNNSPFDSNAVTEYINYLKKYSDKEDLISEIEDVLLKISNKEIDSILTKFSVLFNERDFDDNPELLELTYKYFE